MLVLRQQVSSNDGPKRTRRRQRASAAEGGGGGVGLLAPPPLAGATYKAVGSGLISPPTPPTVTSPTVTQPNDLPYNMSVPSNASPEASRIDGCGEAVPARAEDGEGATNIRKGNDSVGDSGDSRTAGRAGIVDDDHCDDDDDGWGDFESA